MYKFPRTVIEFQRHFADEPACAAYVAATAGMGSVARAAATTAAAEPPSKAPIATVRQTAHHHAGSKLPLTVWFWAAYLGAVLQLWRQLGLGSYKTAWLLCAKLRRAMVAPDRNPLAGLVEIDETTINHRTKEDAAGGGQGRSHVGKLLVAGAVESVGRGPGRVRLAPIGDFSAASLHAFIAASVTPAATIKDPQTEANHELGIDR